ncbi:MAG TPA: DUF3786 domain-containing protein [Dissulfurispiraceae bacterium]|nr:DUF3786 domain-containing protein [Dissulfurispiraceae bacterium]
MSAGEAKAWEILKTLDPIEVCKRAAVQYDAGGHKYIVRSMGRDFSFLLDDEQITGDDLFLKRLGYLFKLSALCYLNSALEIPTTERLIRPSDLKGGQIFFRGTHILPLDGLAAQYGVNSNMFLQKGTDLGAEAASFGDAALRVLPFPRIPVYLILWKQDDEFPARADLLFDSSSEMQAPLDILWSAAMMTVLAMM